MNDYSVFCVSDHTGVTVEAVAKSVVAQFPRLECSLITLPFVDSAD
ncbi:MAG: kinase/pyrophosphorylase, partial [Pseudomonadota bacterium]